MTLRSILAAAAFGLAVAAPAQAIDHVFTATLSGAAEATPTGSPGTGIATVTLNDDTFLMHVIASFSGLTSNDTASHIHCCTPSPGTGTAGVATVTPSFTGFPLGVTFGTYDHVFDMTQASSWNPDYVTANGGTTAMAFTAFFDGVSAGEAYFNIHTTEFPGGEIRGFLVSAVPEPATTALMLAGLAVVGIASRRRRP